MLNFMIDHIFKLSQFVKKHKYKSFLFVVVSILLIPNHDLKTLILGVFTVLILD